MHHEDECDNLPTIQVGARKPFLAYKYWAEHGGEDVLSETAFGLNLSERGYAKAHKKTGAIYLKIGLRSLY